MGEVLICHKCEQEFTWYDGNICICECCGKPICVSCMMENERYRKEINSNIDGISRLEKILCLDCFKSIRREL